MLEKKETARGRAILVGLNCGALAGFDNSDEDTLLELRELAQTAGCEVLMTTAQNRHTPDPHTFIGEGKAKEIAQMVKDHELDIVIFDNEISPSQTRALEDALECRVIDRNALILDIFADRAKTAEGKLQVELAQYKYIAPRLTRMWLHLVRQTASGGSSPIGTRGPGETQLESDRRHIRRRIQKLESELADVKRIRAVQRQKREKSRVPLVCLVGYTNAGKSTLLNALTGAQVSARNRLFDTLDPTTKTMKTDALGDILVSDTVGFIRKLPHHLIEAFKATLEELKYADVLVHVIDASSENWQEQAEVVDKLIEELGASETPCVRVFNKVDLLLEDKLPREAEGVYCSALKGMGLDTLVERICALAGERNIKVKIVLPYTQSAALDLLYRDASVSEARYEEDGIHVEAVCDSVTYGRVRAYLPRESAQ